MKIYDNWFLTVIVRYWFEAQILFSVKFFFKNKANHAKWKLFSKKDGQNFLSYNSFCFYKDSIVTFSAVRKFSSVKSRPKICRKRSWTALNTWTRCSNQIFLRTTAFAWRSSWQRRRTTTSWWIACSMRSTTTSRSIWWRATWRSIPQNVSLTNFCSFGSIIAS